MNAWAGTDDHDTPSNSLNLYLYRGDYVQIKGGWFQSVHYSHFQITRI